MYDTFRQGIAHPGDRRDFKWKWPAAAAAEPRGGKPNPNLRAAETRASNLPPTFLYRVYLGSVYNHGDQEINCCGVT